MDFKECNNQKQNLQMNGKRMYFAQFNANGHRLDSVQIFGKWNLNFVECIWVKLYDKFDLLEINLYVQTIWLELCLCGLV